MLLPELIMHAGSRYRVLRRLAVLLSMAVAAAAASSSHAEDAPSTIHVERPWARATPNGAKVAAGYLTIRNDGDAPDRLVSVTSEAAGRIAPHTMSMADGLMKMRPLADVTIPAHATVTLKPGADHLMLEDLARPLKPGEHFAATLSFDKAGAFPVTFSVEAIGAQAPSGEPKP